MFSPYCPVHQSRVLLFAENIDSIDNSGDGVVVRYHCTCGHSGVWDPREASIPMDRSGGLGQPASFAS